MYFVVQLMGDGSLKVTDDDVGSVITLVVDQSGRIILPKELRGRSLLGVGAVAVKELSNVDMDPEDILDLFKKEV